MTTQDYIIALDQGTTSTRALAFSLNAEVLAVEQLPLQQHFPQNGWVEHDGEEIWDAVLQVLDRLQKRMSDSGGRAVAIGLTNQRETTLVWDRKTGKPLNRAIVWQDRRTKNMCDRIRSDGLEHEVNERTGLLLDPYFSGSKLAWLLDDPTGPQLRLKAENGDVCFGTVESYLLFRLTGGKSHFSDATNASRTMLFDIHTLAPFQTLIDYFKIPESVLPTLAPSSGKLGTIANGLPFAGLVIAAMVGDQQSAAIGQGCIAAGSVKSTYGTGCFLLQNTGNEIVHSRAKLLSTVAYYDGKQASYAIEGSIFNAGTVVQWFRDQLGLIDASHEADSHAKEALTTGGVYMVPAFTGLGAPHWEPDARGIINGLTRDTSRQQLVRAGLESVAYQTVDLLEALKKDGVQCCGPLRIDGGMAKNNWFVQFLSSICDLSVERPQCIETTAFGAALCAGVGIGLWHDLEDATKNWQAESRFEPGFSQSERQEFLDGWQNAVRQCLYGQAK